MTISDYLALVPFLAAVLAASSTGAVFRPGRWYKTLDKPAWTPPDWLFPFAWGALYVAIAVAAWLIWLDAGMAAAIALGVWLVQLILNAGWSAVFFGMRRMGLAFIEVSALWLSIAATIALFYPVSKAAAALMLPYLVWVSFAAALNFEVWRRNRHEAVAG